MGECSLDRQNTVVENLEVSHTQGFSRQKAEAGHFLILSEEDPIEKGMATLHCSCLGNPMDRGA